MVQAFLDRGYRNIAFVTQSDQEGHLADVAPQRELGYRTAMANKGLAALARVIAIPQYGASRDAAIRALLENRDRPRAIFCWSDLDAIPLVSEAHRLGIRVPEDLAVIGYDNSPMAALSMVDLSSVDQDGPRLGKLAADALISRIKGRHIPEHIMIEPQLVHRGSV